MANQGQQRPHPEHSHLDGASGAESPNGPPGSFPLSWYICLSEGCSSRTPTCFPGTSANCSTARSPLSTTFASSSRGCFPAYFNDIGAEGLLRDISTKIDELSHRKDVPCPFHTKAEPRGVEQPDSRSDGWRVQVLGKRRKGDGQTVRASEHTSEYRDERSLYRRASPGIRAFDRPGDFLAREPFWNRMKTGSQSFAKAHPGFRKWTRSARGWRWGLYRLLHQKYHVGFTEFDAYIAQLRVGAFPELDRLRDALREPDLKTRLNRLLEYLKLLQELILSPEEFESREDIYKKRHFTIDIPSMYGSYREMKFDALGLTFRIEAPGQRPVRGTGREHRPEPDHQGHVPPDLRPSAIVQHGP